MPFAVLLSPSPQTITCRNQREKCGAIMSRSPTYLRSWQRLSTWCLSRRKTTWGTWSLLTQSLQWQYSTNTEVAAAPVYPLNRSEVIRGIKWPGDKTTTGVLCSLNVNVKVSLWLLMTCWLCKIAVKLPILMRSAVPRQTVIAFPVSLTCCFAAAAWNGCKETADGD